MCFNGGSSCVFQVLGRTGDRPADVCSWSRHRLLLLPLPLPLLLQHLSGRVSLSVASPQPPADWILCVCVRAWVSACVTERPGRRYSLLEKGQRKSAGSISTGPAVTSSDPCSSQWTSKLISWSWKLVLIRWQRCWVSTPPRGSTGPQCFLQLIQLNVDSLHWDPGSGFFFFWLKAKGFFFFLTGNVLLLLLPDQMDQTKRSNAFNVTELD